MEQALTEQRPWTTLLQLHKTRGIKLLLNLVINYSFQPHENWLCQQSCCSCHSGASAMQSVPVGKGRVWRRSGPSAGVTPALTGYPQFLGNPRTLQSSDMRRHFPCKGSTRRFKRLSVVLVELSAALSFPTALPGA